MKRQSDKLINALNRYDDITIRSASEFFKRHNTPQLEDRVKFAYAADLGSTRALRNVLVTIFYFDRRKFIRFYEGVFSNREVPHYEDALAIVVVALSAISAIGVFLSPIIGVEYGRWRERAAKDRQYISTEDKRELLDLFKYLIKAFALRDACYRSEISRKEFAKLKKISESLIADPTSKHDKKAVDSLEKIWHDFNKTAGLPLNEQLVEEIEKITLEEIQKLCAERRKIKIRRTGSSVLSKGQGVSLGQARGIIKVVNSTVDVDKLSEGDIAVFSYFNSDMLPAIKKCAASIGLPGCGGRTGHLSIVSRELGIPCVIRLKRGTHLKDGMKAVVNGDTGEVKIVV